MIAEQFDQQVAMIQRLNRFTRVSYAQRQKGVGRWLSSGVGQALVAAERRLLERELRTVFGYHAGQFSSFPAADLLSSTSIARQFMLCPDQLDGAPRSQLRADPNHWPVAPGSLDLVLLHHTLEIVENPHRLLSEAASTIIPEGRLMVIGFNPFSLGNLTRWFFPRQYRLLRYARFITPMRLKDWLQLLNFQVERVHYGGYLYPAKKLMGGLRSSQVEQWCNDAHLPLGGFYLITATRQTPGLTPIRPYWPGVAPRLVGHSVPRPSASGSHCDYQTPTH